MTFKKINNQHNLITTLENRFICFQKFCSMSEVVHTDRERLELVVRFGFPV